MFLQPYVVFDSEANGSIFGFLALPGGDFLLFLIFKSAMQLQLTQKFLDAVGTMRNSIFTLKQNFA